MSTDSASVFLLMARIATNFFCGFFRYDLVGVTVHTGTADGGHYYSFIKERNSLNGQQDRWFLFNDAEVKIFDPSQIAAECFGGEMIVRSLNACQRHSPPRFMTNEFLPEQNV